MGDADDNRELLAGLIEAARAAGDTGERASMLVWICKTFDLSDAKYGDFVPEIAQWITSPCDGVRRETVFALCFLNPVPGYERILAEGWRRAPVGDLHWYAGGIESSCNCARKVDVDLVLAVAETLLTPEPAVVEDSSDLPSVEAWSDFRTARADAWRAFRHFAGLFGVGTSAREGPAYTNGTGRAELDWNAVARVLLYVLRRESPRADGTDSTATVAGLSAWPEAGNGAHGTAGTADSGGNRHD